MIKTEILILCFLLSAVAFCQEIKLPEIIKDVAEDIAANDSDPEAAEVFTGRLCELAENPVKINSASEDEISRLFFLSDFQVKALADYSRSSGKITSYYELANIPGFDKTIAEMMIPFITLTSKEYMYSDPVPWRNYIITNLSVRSGKDDTTSLGSALKLLTKYKFTTGRLSGGLTFEKDPGEKFLYPGTIHPDFLSANIAYNGSGIIRRIILGDYSARFGQGTNINTGISTGLSLTSQGYMSGSNEIKPYTSTDENAFFRGIATELSIKNLNLSLFYSKNNIDATLASTSGHSKNYIENLYKSGIHSTSTLLLKKDVISETVYGINLSYNFKNARFGMDWSENRFSLPVNQVENDPEKIFSFKGASNNVYSLYYNSIIKRILFFGELSSNGYKKNAVIQGLSFRPSDRFIINFLYRNYNAGYISFHGKGPGISSETGNEKGILGNFTLEAAKHLFISGGCDIRYFPWLKYRCSSPSWGVKREIRIRFIPTEKLTFDGLYSYRFSMADNTAGNGIPELKQLYTKSVKFYVRYALYENLTIGTRIDYKIVEPPGSKGMLFLEDINYRVRSLPVSFWLRFCVFSTDDYESRLYTWENDLLYTFSIPSLYDKGSRIYLMTGWKISDKAEIRIKYGILTKTDTPGIISNIEEFRIQVKVTI
jgi:hypothetical protein